MKKFYRFLFVVISLTMAAGSLSGIDFQGELFIDYYGDIEPSTPYQTLRTRAFYQPRLYGSLFDYTLDYEISADLYYDILGDNPGFIPLENIIREAYVSVPLGDFDLYIGQKTVSMGMVDLFSPLNVVNGDHAFKLSLDDPYQGKRGDILLQLTYYPTYEDEIDLVYVPFPRPDYEPVDPVSITGSGADIDVEFTAGPYLTSSPHSFFISYSHYDFDYDLQLSYAWYTDQTPCFDLSNLVYSPGSLTGTVETIYTRNHMIGVAYGTYLRETTLVGELALNLTEDFAGTAMGVRNSDITLNTQITGTLWGGTLAQLNIVYQYIFNFNQGGVVYESGIDALLREEFNGYFTQPMEHVAFAVAHLQNSFLHDKLAVSLNLGYLHPSVYLGPKASYALSDRLSIIAGADIMTGDPTTRALARGNLLDNFYFRLKYAY